MDTLSHFRSIEELVKMLDRDKVLFRDMFERRKSLAYRKEFALEVIDYRRERIQYLIDHGVIHENGDFLELENVDIIAQYPDWIDFTSKIAGDDYYKLLSAYNEN